MFSHGSGDCKMPTGKLVGDPHKMKKLNGPHIKLSRCTYTVLNRGILSVFRLEI